MTEPQIERNGANLRRGNAQNEHRQYLRVLAHLRQRSNNKLMWFALLTLIVTYGQSPQQNHGPLIYRLCIHCEDCDCPIQLVCRRDPQITLSGHEQRYFDIKCEAPSPPTNSLHAVVTYFFIRTCATNQVKLLNTCISIIPISGSILGMSCEIQYLSQLCTVTCGQ